MKKSESGQTLVLVLLVTAVSLLVGVGIATRSTSIVQQTTFSEESTQALHFAEACAEEALGMVKSNTLVGDGLPRKFCCDVDGGGGCTEVADPTDAHDCFFIADSLTELFPGKIAQDDVAEVKFESSDCDDVVDGVTLFWCTDGDNCPTGGGDKLGLEVAVIYEEAGSWKIWKQIYGPLSLGFEPPTSPGGEYEYSQTLDLSDDSVFGDNVQAIRLTPRYSGFHIKVEPSDCNLGFQGYDIHTEGWYGRSLRKVRVTKTEPAMPPIFDYSIFSGSETHPLEKN